ncbi:MAG: glycine cleavage system aminomethyltransferase GcvT [Candidatus Margulisiibacteriota bacterium]
MELKRTPLYEEHLSLGAKMVPFAGWEMPVSYKGIIAEHESVRSNCGIFDIGHMGVIDISGSNSLGFIQYAATNDASLLTENECQYSILCNQDGGVIDDILVYRLKDLVRLVVNASNTDAVLAHLTLQGKSFSNLKITHRTDISMFSLQGPKTVEVFASLNSLKRNHCAEWNGILVSRTGYTGEDGFEFFAPKEKVVAVWREFISKNIPPCGLGARDTLRLEAGLPLYGHEYDLKTNPLEAGYSWAVKLDKPDFIGKSALVKIKQKGLTRKLVGLKLQGKTIPRQGFLVKADGKSIGAITSGTFSPTLKIPIALAYLNADFAVPGKELGVEIRDAVSSAVVTSRKLV